MVYDSLSIKNDRDSALFAFNLLSSIGDNISYDANFSEKRLADELDDIYETRGSIEKDEKIISAGVKVTEEKYQVLISLKEEYESTTGGAKKYYLTALGYFILICFSLAILMIYFYLFERSIYHSIRKLAFILILITLMVYLVGAAVRANLPSVFIIPFCIVPITVRAFHNARTALYTLITTILITSFIVPSSFEFAFLNLMVGIFAIFTNIKLHYWSKFLVSSGIILLAYFLGYFGLSLVQEGSLETIDWINFRWLGLNVLLTLLAYPLIPIFERVFGLVSELTLFELSDLN
ncbi:MAG: transmembrane HD family protein, partial [Bacteroidetes bacterium]|nr:transmembrane HD family protein [Bacteroidota bacterium]